MRKISLKNTSSLFQDLANEDSDDGDDFLRGAPLAKQKGNTNSMEVSSSSDAILSRRGSTQQVRGRDTFSYHPSVDLMDDQAQQAQRLIDVHRSLLDKRKAVGDPLTPASSQSTNASNVGEVETLTRIIAKLKEELTASFDSVATEKLLRQEAERKLSQLERDHFSLTLELEEAKRRIVLLQSLSNRSGALDEDTFGKLVLSFGANPVAPADSFVSRPGSSTTSIRLVKKAPRMSPLVPLLEWAELRERGIIELLVSSHMYVMQRYHVSQLVSCRKELTMLRAIGAQLMEALVERELLKRQIVVLAESKHVAKIVNSFLVGEREVRARDAEMAKDLNLLELLTETPRVSSKSPVRTSGSKPHSPLPPWYPAGAPASIKYHPSQQLTLSTTSTGERTRSPMRVADSSLLSHISSTPRRDSPPAADRAPSPRTLYPSPTPSAHGIPQRTQQQRKSSPVGHAAVVRGPSPPMTATQPRADHLQHSPGRKDVDSMEALFRVIESWKSPK